MIIVLEMTIRHHYIKLRNIINTGATDIFSILFRNPQVIFERLSLVSDINYNNLDFFVGHLLVFEMDMTYGHDLVILMTMLI